MLIAALREAYRRRACTVGAMVADTLARIAAWDDPALWIARPHADEIAARARALDALAAADGAVERLPLFGIPFAVKDNIDVAGLPTTAACPEFAYVPVASAPVVERLIAAGGVFVGKTNMDQFATGLVGTRSPYGMPRNVDCARLHPRRIEFGIGGRGGRGSRRDSRSGPTPRGRAACPLRSTTSSGSSRRAASSARAASCRRAARSTASRSSPRPSPMRAPCSRSPLPATTPIPSPGNGPATARFRTRPDRSVSACRRRTSANSSAMAITRGSTPRRWRGVAPRAALRSRFRWRRFAAPASCSIAVRGWPSGSRRPRRCSRARRTRSCR